MINYFFYKKKSYIEYFLIILIKLFFIFTVADFSGDLNLRQRDEENFYKAIQELIRICLTISLFIIGILGIFNTFSLNRIKLIGLFCFSIVVIIFLYASIYGFFANNIANAIREFQPAVALLLIPLFNKIDRYRYRELSVFFIYLLVIVSVIKIIIIQFVAINIYGALSWKVLLRLSPLLILPYCYFLSEILKRQGTKSHFFFLLLTMTALLMANARALNLIILIATFLIFFSSTKSVKIFIFFIIIFLSAFISNLATDGDIKNIFGIWSGDHLANTVDYRKIQAEVLLNRFVDKPIFGFGLGYFTPDYSDYGDLTLPYLLELDLINFFTKIGIPLSFLYLLNYVLFIIQYLKNSVIDSSIQLSYLLSLILLLIYSIFQTSHSSFTFWIIYSMTFSFIFRKS